MDVIVERDKWDVEIGAHDAWWLIDADGQRLAAACVNRGDKLAFVHVEDGVYETHRALIDAFFRGEFTKFDGWDFAVLGTYEWCLEGGIPLQVYY